MLAFLLKLLIIFAPTQDLASSLYLVLCAPGQTSNLQFYHGSSLCCFWCAPFGVQVNAVFPGRSLLILKIWPSGFHLLFFRRYLFFCKDNEIMYILFTWSQGLTLWIFCCVTGKYNFTAASIVLVIHIFVFMEYFYTVRQNFNSCQPIAMNLISLPATLRLYIA